MMKRLIMICVAASLLTACYDDYVKNYDVQGVGFANQTDVRTVVVGEGMHFSTGVALGGVIDNTKNRTVNFEVDPTLVTPDVLTAMQKHTFAYIQTLSKQLTSLAELPANEYTLQPSGSVTIASGSHLGQITVRIDSAAFLADVSRLLPRYVIPLRLTDGNGTNLMESKSTTVIGVHYENMLFGSYWHGGETVVTDAQGAEVNRITYYTTVPQTETRTWKLSTVAPFSLTSNAVGGELNGTAAQMQLTLGENGQITVASVSGATYTVEPDGESTFNRAKLLQNRKIFLKYKYVKEGLTYHATDTLTFRNRIRDGVNEWQDENTQNYK